MPKQYSQNYVFTIIFIAIIIIACLILYIVYRPITVCPDNQQICKYGQDCSLEKLSTISKVNLTDAQKKLSSEILQLTDSRYLPIGVTHDALELQMEQNHQLTHVAETGNTLVYVYIKTSENTDTTIIKGLVWNVTDTDPANHLIVAWMDVNNLTRLASFDFVQSIKPVISPVTRG